MLGAERQRILDPAREHRLVDLDHRAAGLGEAADLDVQRVGERGAARPGVVPVMVVRDAVADRERPGTVIFTGLLVALWATCQSRTRNGGPAAIGPAMVGSSAW